MSLWPELRGSYRIYTGRDLAMSDLDEFLEHVLWYVMNSADTAPQRREAFNTALRGDYVEGAEFEDTATSMINSGLLDAFERERTSRSVE